MNASLAPRAASRITFGQDIRRTFLRGLLFGAILALTSGVCHFLFPLQPALLLSLVAASAIDIVASWRVARSTHSVRAGIMTCLWANLVYLMGTPLVVLVASTPFEIEVNGGVPSLLISATLVAGIPAIILSVLFGWMVGRLGTARTQSPHEDALSPATAQLAAQNQLGMLIQSYRSMHPSRALAFGIGTAIFVIVLFVIQRSLGVSGTSIFEDVVVAIIGSIATVYQANKRRGQQVAVYQHGLLVPGSDQQLVALRWEEIDTHYSRLEEQRILLQTKHGFRIALSATFTDFADLKTTIAAHLLLPGREGCSIMVSAHLVLICSEEVSRKRLDIPISLWYPISNHW